VTAIEWQIMGLDRLVLLWKSRDEPLWAKDAELYIQHRPGTIAVELLTTDGDRLALVTKMTKNTGPNPPALAFDGLPKSLITKVAAAKVPLISDPIGVSSGGRQWAIAYPVYSTGQLRGFIVAFFDLKQSLDYILDDAKNLGFSFAVVPPNQPEYLLPGSSREHEQEWGEMLDVPLPGTTWQVRVWPKTDVIHVVKSSLPEAALIVGIVLSLLLSVAIYFALDAAHSSARRARANDALQREINKRQGAEEELRRAHAGLEVRIEQRTDELAGANALLQKEIAEHERAERSLRELTGRLFQLQDEERRHLARELHDGTTQNLIALALNVAQVGKAVPVECSREKELLNECALLIQQSTDELRTMSYLLHPPLLEERGLLPALRSYVDGFTQRSGIQVNIELDPRLGRLDHAMELGMYRIVQEALANVHRHAGTSTASVLLSRRPTGLLLEISDTGVGIAGIRERVRFLGGTFDLHSSCQGTRLRIGLPVAAERSFVTSSTA
jgi:signal transduction histidine kinase